MRNGCPFCDYSGPSPILADYGDFIVFEPLNPVVAGHVLIVPKEHVANARTSLRVTGDTFAHAADWASRNPQYIDFNLITSAGAWATQTIEHLHVHFIPRRPDDGLRLPWTATPVKAGNGNG